MSHSVYVYITALFEKQSFAQKVKYITNVLVFWYIFYLHTVYLKFNILSRDEDPVLAKHRIRAGFLNIGHWWYVWRQKYENKREGF